MMGGLREALKKCIDLRNLVGAEVGVEHGEYAHDILLELKMDLLYLVDPYIVQWTGSNALSNIPLTVEESQAIFRKAHINTAPHEAKNKFHVRWIHKFSWEVDEYDIPNESLDFAYLDANHVYGAVKMDVLTYWPKIKPGGMLCGHDWNFPSVQKAVNEFLKEYEGEHHGFGNTGDKWRGDWWVHKNKEEKK